MGASSSGRDTAPDKPSLGQRLRHELRDYATVAAYLYVCFALVLFYQIAVLDDAGDVTSLPFGLAAIKALIMGKFVLIGKAAGVGSRGRTRSVLHLLARKSALLWLLLIVLTVLEERLAGLVHGRPLTATLAEYAQGSALEPLASRLVMLLILIPLVSASEIRWALGPGVLMRTLRMSPMTTPAPHRD